MQPTLTTIELYVTHLIKCLLFIFGKYSISHSWLKNKEIYPNIQLHSTPPRLHCGPNCAGRWSITGTLLWRHDEPNGVLNHQPHDCLLNRLFGHRPKKISKLRVTGLCAGNSPGTGEFLAQMASTAGNVSIWWRHHGFRYIEEFKWFAFFST